MFNPILVFLFSLFYCPINLILIFLSFTIVQSKVANYASPSITPLDTVDRFGTTHLGHIQSVPAIALDWDASAAAVQQGLATLPYVRQVQVTRSTATTSEFVGESAHFVGYTWTVTFLSYGSYHHEGFVPLLAATGSHSGKSSFFFLNFHHTLKQ